MTTPLAPDSPADLSPGAVRDGIADLTTRRETLAAEMARAEQEVAVSRAALVDGTGSAGAVTAAQSPVAALTEALAEVAARRAPLTAERAARTATIHAARLAGADGRGAMDAADLAVRLPADLPHAEAFFEVMDTLAAYDRGLTAAGG